MPQNCGASYVFAICCILGMHASADDAPSQQRVDAFKAWLLSNGATLKGVDVFASGTGYGVMATEYIRIGEMFVDIPAKLAMNERSALRTPVAPVIADLSVRAGWGPHSSLLVSLVYESFHNAASFWAPYLRLLPLSFDGHPSFLNDFQHAVASNITSLRRIRRHRLVYESAVWYLDNVFARYPALFGADTPTQREQWISELLWASTIIDTRAYTARFPGDGVTLIPFLDLLNHQNNGSFSGYSVPSAEELRTIVSYHKAATIDYGPGDEVWAKYIEPPDDSACNDAMFQIWGFTLPSTENYCVKFTLLYRAPKDAAQHEANAVAMARSGVRCINCTPDGEFEAVVLKARDAVIPDRVLSMFRIMEAPSTDDPLLHAFTTNYSRPLSLSTERRALRSLVGVLQDLQNRVLGEQEWLHSLVAPRGHRTRLEDSLVDIVDGQVIAVAQALRAADASWVRMLYQAGDDANA